MPMMHRKRNNREEEEPRDEFMDPMDLVEKAAVEPEEGQQTGKRKRRKLSEMPGFRKRVNPYYRGMTKKQIAIDTAKTTGQWVLGTVFLFAYWLAMLLILSLLLLSIWRVKFTTLFLIALGLGIISSLIYAYVLVHRKFYY